MDSPFPHVEETGRERAFEGEPDGLLAHAVMDPRELAELAEAERRRRRRQRVAAMAVAFSALVAAAALVAQAAFTEPGTSGGRAPRVAVTAQASGVVVLRPGRDPERVAAASPIAGSSLREVAASASHAVDATGSVAVVERMRSEASLSVRERTSSATSSIERVELFDGRVTIEAARIQARADSTDGRADGSVQLAPSTRVLLDGTPIAATPNRKVAVQGIGTVLLNEQAVVAAAPTGDAQTGPRHRVVAAIAHVRLTRAWRGLPAGTEVIIGRVDAGVREGKVRETAHPPAGSNPAPVPALPASIAGSLPGVQAGSPRPGDSSLPRRPATVRGTGSFASSGSLQTYLFPVLGRHDYSNDYGAPRASTGIPHQGNDIFADEGTPLVAVADGVLDRVGWNSIGGYRFWLFDRYGNSFYYAHLSAFSPLAKDGATVKAGDVIGFVGHTGDAQYTPPHVHFEIHPGNGAPTNPFPFLNAWKRGVAVAVGLLAGDEQKTAPLSLLGFTDISANSGLQESVLDSVPDTKARPVEQENAPVPTDQSLKGAIEGPGISRG